MIVPLRLLDPVTAMQRVEAQLRGVSAADARAAKRMARRLARDLRRAELRASRAGRRA